MGNGMESHGADGMGSDIDAAKKQGVDIKSATPTDGFIVPVSISG